MQRHKDADRMAYYRQQASACATAALATAIAEVQQAYLDLEQGWLCLAPKAKESLDSSRDAELRSDTDTQVGRAADENAVADVNCHHDTQKDATQP